MNLYYYKNKDDKVKGYLNLGELTEREIELLDHVLIWLEREKLLKKSLMLAEKGWPNETYQLS